MIGHNRSSSLLACGVLRDGGTEYSDNGDKRGCIHAFSLHSGAEAQTLDLNEKISIEEAAEKLN
jgi:hypothetical protein